MYIDFDELRRLAQDADEVSDSGASPYGAERLARIVAAALRCIANDAESEYEYQRNG